MHCLDFGELSDLLISSESKEFIPVSQAAQIVESGKQFLRYVSQTRARVVCCAWCRSRGSLKKEKTVVK